MDVVLDQFVFAEKKEGVVRMRRLRMHRVPLQKCSQERLVKCDDDLFKLVVVLVLGVTDKMILPGDTIIPRKNLIMLVSIERLHGSPQQIQEEVLGYELLRRYFRADLTGQDVVNFQCISF